MTHFQVNHTAPTPANTKETIEQLESMIGGFIFWLDEDAFGGRKDDTNFVGKITKDGKITVEFDKQ